MVRANRDERVQRLTKAARERSTESLAAARRAIMTLRASNEAITPTSVAREAGLSVSYVSGKSELRTEIRAAAGTALSSTQTTDSEQSDASSKTKLSVATDRLREQEVELNRLRRENAILRGEVLELRRSARVNPGRTQTS